MDKNKKIIVVKSKASFDGGRRLFWLFSKNQLELVLKEIERIPTVAGEGFCEAAIAWQDEVLPVVNLEKYFGIHGTARPSPTKHLILRGVAHEDREVKASMLAIPVFTDVKTGALTFSGKSIQPAILKENGTDILGAWELSGGKIVVIPDICKIARRGRTAMASQGQP